MHKGISNYPRSLPVSQLAPPWTERLIVLCRLHLSSGNIPVILWEQTLFELSASKSSSSLLTNPYFERDSCSSKIREVILSTTFCGLVQKTWMPKTSHWRMQSDFRLYWDHNCGNSPQAPLQYYTGNLCPPYYNSAWIGFCMNWALILHSLVGLQV